MALQVPFQHFDVAAWYTYFEEILLDLKKQNKNQRESIKHIEHIDHVVMC